MADAVEPLVVRRGEGKLISGPVGGPTTITAHTDNTGGASREDEMWYVLDGNSRFIVPTPAASPTSEMPVR